MSSQEIVHIEACQEVVDHMLSLWCKEIIKEECANLQNV